MVIFIYIFFLKWSFSYNFFVKLYLYNSVHLRHGPWTSNLSIIKGLHYSFDFIYFGRLFTDGILTDLVIRVGKKEFHVHKIIFKEM